MLTHESPRNGKDSGILRDFSKVERFNMQRIVIAFLSLTLLLGGCASVEEDETLGWPASKLYEEARGALDNGEFDQAVEYYEKLQARYPFGRYALQAQLETAYTYYQYDEPLSAIATLDRFIKFNPNHPAVSYAYYLRGVVNSERADHFLDFLWPYDQEKYDPQLLRDAFRDFKEIVTNHPESRYAEEAGKRLVGLRESLAQSELYVAKFYMKREAWLAAANRTQWMIKEFPGAEATKEALLLQIEAYKQLKLDDLAEDSRRILELNFPEQAS